MLGRGALERATCDAGLHGRREVGRGELEDPVHPSEVERDASRDRDHVALEARADPEGDDRHPVLVGEREHRRDLRRRERVHDEVGSVGPVEGDVLGVEVAVGVAGRDAALVAERRDERGVELVGRHFSRGCQPNRFAATR